MSIDLLLATLVHVSDLHFGGKFITDAGAFKKLLASIPLYQGTFAHSYAAARALAARVKQIIANRKSKRVPTCVVFTGDLTRGGEEDEFVVGSTFLRSEHFTGAGDPVGLKLAEARKQIGPGADVALFIVPGNHDIWNRRQPDTLGAYRNHFPGNFPSAFEIRTQGRPVRLHGLDSTQNTQLRHRLARGRVPIGELDLLSNALEVGLSKEPVQIVCLHHALSDPKGKTFDKTMRLDEREQIAKRLVKAGADLVLAGHLHKWFVLHAQRDFPAHAVVGSGTQQLSARSFFVLDVLRTKIQLRVFEYDDSTLEFCPRRGKPYIFSIRERRSRRHGSRGKV